MSKWYKASELERLKTLTPRDGVTGLPDNHVITVSERVISIDNTELIQNNIATDTFTLVLDAEWDDITPIAIFSNPVGNYSVMYEGSATKIPAKVMERTGDVEVSVYGVNEAGDVRVVTQRPESMGMTVIESGKFDGQVSSDDVSLLGKILAAVEKAEQSVETANQSAENADTAAQSATDAATKATQAASTANTAANTANTAASNADSSANTADTAAERAENAYDVLTPIIAEIGVNGNQPRATTNPNHIATASDAYAAKPLEICIKGATRQNLWVNPSGTKNGVTVTSNADGSMTISGLTNDDIATVYAPNSYVLKPNTTYTVSCDKKIDATAGASCFTITEHGSDGSQLTYHDFAYSDNLQPTTVTFTTKANARYYRFRLYMNRNTTVSGTYRVMLNEGSEAEPWCPPGLNSVDELSMVCAGKNLVDIDDIVDRTVKNNYYDLNRPSCPMLPPGTYTVSADIKSTLEPFGLDITVGDSSPSEHITGTGDVKNNGHVSFSFTLDAKYTHYKNIYFRLCRYSSQQTYTYSAKNIQLELGSTATAYEPPQITTTPIDLDGHPLNSLPDGTCDELIIEADGSASIVKRVYEQTVTGSRLANNYTSNDEAATIFGVSDGLDYETSGFDNAASGGTARGDVLPPVDFAFQSSSLGFSSTNSTYAKALYVNAPCDSVTDFDGARAWLDSNPLTILYPLATPQTIPLTAVTLPTLPSPNITVYHDSDVPSDITVEYVQDINIVLDNLNAKIAALNIAQSISS